MLWTHDLLCGPPTTKLTVNYAPYILQQLATLVKLFRRTLLYESPSSTTYSTSWDAFQEKMKLFSGKNDQFHAESPTIQDDAAARQSL